MPHSDLIRRHTERHSDSKCWKICSNINVKILMRPSVWLWRHTTTVFNRTRPSSHRGTVASQVVDNTYRPFCWQYAKVKRRGPIFYSSDDILACSLFIQLFLKVQFYYQCLLETSKRFHFCRTMLCISTAYAVMRCLSVRPSVRPSATFVDSVETNKRILIFFHHWVATPFSFFRTKLYGNIQTETP